MFRTQQINIPEKVAPFNRQGFTFNFSELRRLRFPNHTTANFLSTLLVSLFADFYPTLKH